MITKTQFATHPNDFLKLSAEEVRERFLEESLFVANEVTAVYTTIDRMVFGGIMPVGSTVELKAFALLKAEHFLQRREMGVINVGGDGLVEVDGVSYPMQNLDAIYIGMGCQKIVFHSLSAEEPAKFYFNSTPAHCSHPIAHVKSADAIRVELGSDATSNRRTIVKLIVSERVPTCQLQMGMTMLHNGSVWNTMPPHVHLRRMEVYFYFNLQPDQAICHFMGQSSQTRQLWLQNEQAVISPEWSIHAGVGTGSYSFIWGMGGENADYTDVDPVALHQLK